MATTLPLSTSPKPAIGLHALVIVAALAIGIGGPACLAAPASVATAADHPNDSEPGGPTEATTAAAATERSPPAVAEAPLVPVPETAVLYEIVEGVPDLPGWPMPLERRSESFTGDTFALVDLPARYTDTGVRADSQLPLVLRARGRVLVPAGPQRIRVRVRGEARVLLDGRQVAGTNDPGRRADGHEKMYVPDRSGPAGMRWVQPGDQEAVVDIEGDGG
ncbi:MAG: hypothetical protein ACKO6B_03075, partial [Planctomycetia bacterium]